MADDLTGLMKAGKQMIDSLPAAIYTTDPDGRLTHFNPAAVEFSGRKPKLGTDQWCVTWKLYYPDGSPMPHDECPMALSLKEQRSIEGEAVAERPDGERIWFRAYPSPLWNDRGEMIGGINMLIDITDEKRDEEERRRQEQELNDFFENANIGLHWVRSDGIIKKVNHAELEMLGYSRDEYVGRHIADFHADQEVIDTILQKLSAGEELQDYEARLRCRDGSIRHVLISSNVYRQDGKFIHTRCITRDISERKQAQEELQALNETLEERVKNRTAALLSYQDQLRTLASRLSKAEEFERHRLAAELHDNLGQMLAVGKMKADLLHRNHRSDGVRNDIDALKGVIEEALTYTRNLMTELKPPPSLDEGDLLTKMEWVARKMEKHDLKVDIRDDGRSKPLSEELQTTLIQCVRELLYNVVKHTGVNEARVSLTRNDRQIQVVVADEGSGFDPEEVSAPSEKGGFGLFNIQERIDMVGGSMNIESGPGSGTRACLTIPLDDSNEAETVPRELPARPETPAYTGNADIIRIMLADDHQMVREGLRKIIEEEEDMTVIGEAADGEEAVALSLEYSPDIILMDINMPKMDGIEATRMIRGKLPDVRVIGLSLHDDEGVIRDMRSVGATAYLTKNEAFESLVSTIRAEASAPRDA